MDIVLTWQHWNIFKEYLVSNIFFHIFLELLPACFKLHWYHRGILERLSWHCGLGWVKRSCAADLDRVAYHNIKQRSAKLHAEIWDLWGDSDVDKVGEKSRRWECFPPQASLCRHPWKHPQPREQNHPDIGKVRGDNVFVEDCNYDDDDIVSCHPGLLGGSSFHPLHFKPNRVHFWSRPGE